MKSGYVTSSVFLSAKFAILLLTAVTSPAFAESPTLPNGNATIRGPYSETGRPASEIVITTTDRLAGAIHSLTWNGKEFIDSADHGRQLQSASNFDIDGAFHPETFNPTEAGSVFDGAGPTSTSRLLHLIADEHKLQTTSQMAFWLRPDGQSAGHPAANKRPLSNHTLTKRVTIGYRDLPNVIQYDVTFGLPVNETHKFAQFEALTGYMPPEFSRFMTWDPATGKLAPLSDGPGEQPLPVVLATVDGSHAMGIYTPQQGTPTAPSYGRWNFKHARVVKWNCVFRYRDANQVPPVDYTFRCFVIVGSSESVARSLQTLHASFNKK